MFARWTNRTKGRNANGLRKGARKRDRASLLKPTGPLTRRKPSGPDGPRPAPEGARKLRGELDTAATTAGTNYLAATWGRLACEETVATGTHEIARLERPLHIVLE